MALYNKLKEHLRKGRQGNTTIRDYSELGQDEKTKVLGEMLALKTGSEDLYTGYEAEVTTLYDMYNHTKIRYDQENELIKSNKIQYYPTADNPNPDVDEQSNIKKAKKEIYSLLATGEYEIVRKEFEDIQADLEVRYNAITRAMSFINDNTPSYGQLLAELEKVKALFKRVQEILEEVNCQINKLSKGGTLEDSFKALMERLNKGKHKTVFIDTLCKILSNLNLRRVEYDDFANDVRSKILSLVDRLENHFSNELVDSISCALEKPIDEALREFVRWNCDGKLSEKETIDELLLELFKLLAEYMHTHEKYVYGKKDEYKEPLKEAQDAIEEFQNTPITAWKKFEETPYEHMLHLKSAMYHYTRTCPNYVTPELKNEITKTYAKLNWLRRKYKIGNIGSDCIFYSPSGDYDESRISNEESEKYVKGFQLEMLKEIEKKFSVSLRELGCFNRNKNEFISDIWFDVLADILVTGKLPALYLHPTIEHPINYICGSKHKIFYFDGSGETIRLDVLYHYLRAINKDDIRFDFSSKMLVNSNPSETFAYPSSMDNLLALITESALNKQYDDRILIVSSLTDKPLDIINSNNRIKAVYISDNKKLQEIISTPNSLKCIFIPECFNGAIASDSDYTLPSGTKIIIVPNDVTYSELSDILNQEIAKTEEAKRNVYTEQ